METNYLAIKWTVSRGRDTYGYNIVTLTDQDSGKRYSCNGGGYDMTGTVFGQWLMDTHRAELLSIAGRAYDLRVIADPDKASGVIENRDGLYGMRSYSYTYDSDLDYVHLDGACGLSSMERIAEAIGLTIKHTYDRKGQTTGFIVTTP